MNKKESLILLKDWREKLEMHSKRNMQGTAFDTLDTYDLMRLLSLLIAAFEDKNEMD